LTKIEGIGPVIQEALYTAGIKSYRKLSFLTEDQIKAIFDGRFATAKPKTWAQQAALASKGKWDELKKWQDELVGGV
jgi:predicted flap endonuclease-1-like 5' DNA nuclease